MNEFRLAVEAGLVACFVVDLIDFSPVLALADPRVWANVKVSLVNPIIDFTLQLPFENEQSGFEDVDEINVEVENSHFAPASHSAIAQVLEMRLSPTLDSVLMQVTRKIRLRCLAWLRIRL